MFTWRETTQVVRIPNIPCRCPKGEAQREVDSRNAYRVRPRGSGLYLGHVGTLLYLSTGVIETTRSKGQ